MFDEPEIPIQSGTTTHSNRSASNIKLVIRDNNKQKQKQHKTRNSLNQPETYNAEEFRSLADGIMQQYPVEDCEYEDGLDGDGDGDDADYYEDYDERDLESSYDNNGPTFTYLPKEPEPETDPEPET